MLFALPAKIEENHLFSEQRQAQMADLPNTFSEVIDDNMTEICKSPHSWALSLSKDGAPTQYVLLPPDQGVENPPGLSHLCPTEERLNNMESRCTQTILQLTDGSSMAHCH